MNHQQKTGQSDSWAAAESLHRQLNIAAELGLRFALAALLGFAAARLMRRRGLHWSWSTVPLVLLSPLRPALGAFAQALSIMALAAAGFGRRWHRRDRQAGGDLGRMSRTRRTPAGTLREVAHAFRSRAARKPNRTGELVLGRQRDGRDLSIPFEQGPAGHTLVVGATGSGKTVTQTLIAVRSIEAGLGAIVIDPKGDGAMREHLRWAALGCGREFLEWTPVGPTVYNPCEHGRDTEIADRVLAGEPFSEPHYLRQAQRYLGHVVRTLQAGGEEVALKSIVALLEPGNLEAALRALPEELAAAGHAYLDSLTARQLRDLSGVRDRLAILTESDVGRWLDPCTEGSRRIALIDAARARAVVYLKLESDSRPLLAKMLGAAIVQDLQSTVAALQGEPAPTLLAIDEFSAVAAEQVVGLFGRARSAGFRLLLGTQELSDLRLPGRERLLEQVMGNLSLLIAHRQVVPGSADLIARLGGTRGTWKVTWTGAGRTTRTRTHEPLVEPEGLMRLAPGWATVIALGDPRGARIARVRQLGGDL